MNESSAFSEGQSVAVFDQFAKRWTRGVVMRVRERDLMIATEGYVLMVVRELVRAVSLVEAHP